MDYMHKKIHELLLQQAKKMAFLKGFVVGVLFMLLLFVILF